MLIILVAPKYANISERGGGGLRRKFPECFQVTDRPAMGANFGKQSSFNPYLVVFDCLERVMTLQSICYRKDTY